MVTRMTGRAQAAGTPAVVGADTGFKRAVPSRVRRHGGGRGMADCNSALDSDAEARAKREERRETENPEGVKKAACVCRRLALDCTVTLATGLRTHFPLMPPPASLAGPGVEFSGAALPRRCSMSCAAACEAEH
eukprot:500274-Rhodomonas_salina.2